MQGTPSGRVFLASDQAVVAHLPAVRKDRKLIQSIRRPRTRNGVGQLNADAAWGHIEEIYCIEAAPGLISAITDAVMAKVTAWQNAICTWRKDRSLIICVTFDSANCGRTEMNICT